MRAHLGWYAHHHGRGHVHRATAVLTHLRHPATLLTSAMPPPAAATTLRLPLDLPTLADTVVDDVPLPAFLHYAPVGVQGLRRRIADLAAWFADADPAVVVVDVSVEVTLLARLSGVATVVVRQAGQRTDPAHRAAYDAAALLLAPWPQRMEAPTTPAAIRERTYYTGGFSRFDGRPTLPTDQARRAAGLRDDARHVVVVLGAGGEGFGPREVAAAAAATPEWRWTVLGAADGAGSDRLDVRGWVADPWPLLCAADVVVTHAGTNAVFETAAARRPLVVVPAPRPFDEQHEQAARLRELDAAVVADPWPPPQRWQELLEQAAGSDPGGLASLAAGNGARNAAERLDQFVEELCR